MSPRLARACALAGTMLMLAPLAPVGAQRAAVTSPVFVVRDGGDTVLVERARRTADSLTGDVTVRRGNMNGARVRHAMGLNADGTVLGIDVTLTPPGADSTSPGVRRVSIRFVAQPGGAAVAEIRQGADTTAQRIPTQAGAIPVVDASIAGIGQIVRRARALGGDSTAVPLFLLNGGRTVTTYIVKQGADSVWMVTGDTRVTLHVDATGEVLGGGDPARSFEITRADRSTRAPAKRP